ncbi:hypothetical protein IAQ61_009911, partial [Plenodomus lingam]|uniref:uncharacterized protein n=1 Tax=Leptosphaeria maculans TaxID=5022 RepID=UPI0033326935
WEVSSPIFLSNTTIAFFTVNAAEPREKQAATNILFAPYHGTIFVTVQAQNTARQAKRHRHTTIHPQPKTPRIRPRAVIIMAIFPSKSQFLRLGVQPITPSPAHVSQDCVICKDPLALRPHITTSTPPSHPALRIESCGHTLGLECLSAWLNVSNTCPTCSRTLFQVHIPRITQEDIDVVIRSLGHRYGVDRIVSLLAQRIRKQDLEAVVMMQKNQEETRRDQFEMAEQDWLDNGDELDVGGDDDDDEEEEFDAHEAMGVDEDDEDKRVLE